jgi:hypothetical protein
LPGRNEPLPLGPARGQPADIATEGTGDLQPVLSTLSRASAIPLLSGLREIHRGYLEADRLVGAMCLTGANPARRT